MKRFLCLLLALLLPCAALAADSLPVGGAAPYPPVESALSADGMSYDDGTISVRVETDEAYGTPVYYVYVTITDPTQLRTALAADWPSKRVRTAVSMAENNNAVLAINGDYFAYHSEGIVYRGGQKLRWNPRAGRDTLIIDRAGDFHLIAPTDSDTVAAFEEDLREVFCFGPALIIDGEVQEFNYKQKTSCGYPTPAQRIVLCQLDTLSYLIVACEGPEQDKSYGLNVPQMTELCAARGVKQAYNLDGGSSVAIILCGRRINPVGSNERKIGDIIYFATLREE